MMPLLAGIGMNQEIVHAELQTVLLPGGGGLAEDDKLIHLAAFSTRSPEPHGDREQTRESRLHSARYNRMRNRDRNRDE